MTITKKRLYSHDSAATMRAGLVAADAATWRPDDEVTPDDVILDAREWETVRAIVEFTDGAGAAAVGTSITVEALLGVPSDLATGATGRVWEALPTLGAIVPGQAVEVALAGHFAAFRVTAINLAGGAVDGRIRVTGGRLRNVAPSV